MTPGPRPENPEDAGDPGEDTTRPGTPDLGSDRYVIQESVGQGGMGEVYRALDRQLDRVVAIKAIRPDLASKPHIVRRLAREARMAASLDHPFICKVHELIERENGQAFLVMEYVEGDTLKALLRKGPLELASAVRLAREVAEALSVAHQRGLVHRDIKPANIMMTPHGHVKVMDFGVAKALDAPEASTTSTLTGLGHVVGTPAYMSPEQAAGERVDHRSDIFSFGVVVYECLFGQLPFEGSSAAGYLREAAVAEPRPLPKHVPVELRALVHQCLEKTPEKRIESFAAVRAQLDTAALSLLSVTSTLTFAQRVRLGPRPWVAAVALVAVALGGYWVISQLRSGDPGASRLLVQRPVVTWPSVEQGSRLSPEGATVTFISNKDGGTRLWIRSIAGSEPAPITPVLDAIKTPAWSPDGKQITHLFRNGGRAWLQIVSVWGEAAGPARPIGGAWDDVAVVRWIGKRIYFSVSSGSSTSILWRHDTTTGADDQVTHASGKRFTSSGQTVNIDVRRDEARIVFVAANPEGGLWTADLDGRNAARLPVEADLVLTPRWKGPDGKRILYVANENGQTDLWEYSLDTRTKVALTTSPLEEEAIDLSMSGRAVVADTVEQVSHLWSAPPDAVSASVQLTNDSRSDLWPSISAAGRSIVHRRQGAFVVDTPTDTEILTARWVNGRLIPEASIGPGTGGGISADGRRVFFLRWTTASSGAPELWVRDLDTPDPGRKIWDYVWFPGRHIDTWEPLGQSATWAPRGSEELFFVRRTAATEPTFDVVRAAVAGGEAAAPQVLATAHGEQRFSDVSVSDDGTSLAFVSTSRRPYRGGTVQVLDLGRPGAAPKIVFESAEGAQLHVKGWTRRGTLVVLKSRRPDLGNTTEIWEIGPRGPQHTATATGLLGMTARLDASRDRLFATSVDRGLSTVRMVSLPGGSSRTVVTNAVDGITFGGYAVSADGWLVYMRKETNKDVWIFHFADRQSGGASQGEKR